MASRNPKFHVSFFQRKPRVSSYSLEFIFRQLRTDLAERINAHVCIAPFFSNGVVRRFLIMLHAWYHQSEINHVTGDINFVGLALRGKRTVLTILDCGDVMSRKGVVGYLLRKLWFEWPAKRAAIVTTISEASKADILELTGCSEEKVVVVPVAVSEEFEYRPSRPFPEIPRILQVGTSPNKNLERVVSALRGLNCELVVIGELTPLQVRALNDAKIKYENYVGLSTCDLFRQYELCDVVVFVSLFEGFGMPIVEANVVGRPVVTSNVASMPEVAGAAACLVDPLNENSIREGIVKVLTDTTYRNALVAKGRENARRFNSQSIANQYLAVYQRLLSGGPVRKSIHE